MINLPDGVMKAIVVVFVESLMNADPIIELEEVESR
jgi:hypothetical protein